MFGHSDLKEIFQRIGTTDICPVKDCKQSVDRQVKVFKRLDNFKCPDHHIYISPSTFEYETENDNLLWTDNSDLELFNAIKTVKRESRIARDNSEDAVSWNVFRFLDRRKLLNPLLSKLSGKQINESELILWSYSPNEKSQWSLLNAAREEFGEVIARGSEPDIIVLTDKGLFFIEAKFLSGNETSPTNKSNSKKYLTGGNDWYNSVFKNSYQDVAISSEKYELLRFWLLGTWIADKLNTDFYLLSLVLQERDTDIEKLFGKHIHQDTKKIFKRITWEDIYSFIATLKLADSDTNKMKWYFQNKTQGYNSGQLTKGFSV